MKYRELYEKLLEYAPMEISDRFVAEGAYDNSGMILETEKEIKSVVFCLDLTEDSVKYATEKGAEAIVTHHPAIYRPVKSLLDGSAVLKAANAGIGIISNHLNLDGAKEGIDYYLAKGLGGEIVGILDNFGNGEGYGRLSVSDTTVGELAERYKKEFGTERVWIYGDKNKRITKYASFCGAGLGDAEVEQAIAAGAELVVSADIPHHVLLNAIQKGLCVLSCTHYGTENYGMKKFSEKCAAEIKNLKIYFFEDERFI